MFFMCLEGSCQPHAFCVNMSWKRFRQLWGFSSDTSFSFLIFCVVCIKIVSGKTFKFLRFFCMRQLTDCLSVTKYDFSKVCFLYVFFCCSLFTALCYDESWLNTNIRGCEAVVFKTGFLLWKYDWNSPYWGERSFQQKSTDNNDAFSEFFRRVNFSLTLFYSCIPLSFTCVSCDVSMSHFLIVWWREILRYQVGCVSWI